MAEISTGNTFEGNVTPQIDPPQVGLGLDTDKIGVAVLTPKHPHWRNDPRQKQRMDKYADIADPTGHAYQGDIHSRLDDLTTIGNDHTKVGPP